MNNTPDNLIQFPAKEPLPDITGEASQNPLIQGQGQEHQDHAQIMVDRDLYMRVHSGDQLALRAVRNLYK